MEGMKIDMLASSREEKEPVVAMEANSPRNVDFGNDI